MHLILLHDLDNKIKCTYSPGYGVDNHGWIAVLLIYIYNFYGVRSCKNDVGNKAASVHTYKLLHILASELTWQ